MIIVRKIRFIYFWIFSWCIFASQQKQKATAPIQTKECLSVLRALPSISVSSALSHYLFMFDVYREPVFEQFWRLYFEDDKFAHWIEAYDFNVFEKDKITSLLEQYHSLKASLPPVKSLQQTINLDEESIKGPASEMKLRRNVHSHSLLDSQYELQLLHVRQGDKLIVGGKKFTIKKFLGSGNATLVFETLEYPNAVLRIPLLNPSLAAKIHDLQGTLYVDSARNKLINYVKRRPTRTDINVVKVIESGTNGEYALVDKIAVLETGTNFLNRMARKYEDELSKIKSVEFSRSRGKTFLETREAIARLSNQQDAKTWLNLLKALDVERNSYPRNTWVPDNETLARQYALDEENQWNLLDWE